MKLDDGSGLGVLEHIQRLPLPAPADVVLTSYAFPEFEVACRMRGAAAFIDEAQDLAPLLDVLQQALLR